MALVSALAALAALAPGALAAHWDGGPDAEAVLGDVEGAFRRWVAAHAKPYLGDAAEFARRLDVFRANAALVREHNARRAATTMQLNQFADLTFDEFSAAHLGYRGDLVDTPAHAALTARLPTFRHADGDAPDAVDWTERGAVTGVKNQGQCGSCWAFSTTGSVEAINYLDTGKLVALSEQELVDCDRSHDNGCGGGLMDFAFEYILRNGGLDTERDYSYWGAVPSFCNRRKQRDRVVVDITGFEDVPANDEAALAKAVAAQPVSVAICVDPSLQFYRSGVFGGACCTGLNHGVLVVGYGADGDSDGGGGADGARQPFWKVKNSWGTGWGEHGYFRLRKDTGGAGQCGVAMKASYPVKDDGRDPAVPTICDPQWFSLWECPAHTKCQCEWSLFGLLCLDYSCQPREH